MTNTYITLGIFYTNQNNIITNIIKNTTPLKDFSLISKKPYQYVLEINAGLSYKWGITIGVKIKFY